MSETTELLVPETMHIDPAAPADPPEEQRERPKSPHATMMEQIARRYEENQRGHEIAYGEELTRDAEARYTAEHPDEAVPEVAGGEHDAASVVTSSDPAASRVPGTLAQPQQTAPSPSAAPVSPPADTGRRTITLQGQPFSVTEEQFQRLAEVGALANLAMNQAPQAPPQQHVQQPRLDAPQQGHHTGQAIDPEEARAIVQRLSYGSSEDGVAAVQELAANIARRIAPQQIDAAQISQQAAQNAMAQIQFHANLNQVGAEYPDIFQDETRAYVAAIHLTKLRQQDAMLGRQRHDLELYREACNRVRAALTPSQPQSGDGSGETAAQAAPRVAVNPQRLEGKRAAPRNPAAVSRSANTGSEGPRELTASQIIDQIRKGRGQLPLN